MKLSIGTTFLIALLSSIGSGLQAQYTLIPDSAFEARLIQNNIDSEGVHDGRILTADAEATTELIMTSAGITDFTGLEAFVNVEEFWPAYNPITSLDISHMTSLVDLRVTATEITELDVSNNTALQTLYVIATNGMTSIDLSNNTDIRWLLLGVNDLQSLDVSNLTELRTLHVNSNPALDSLDVSNNELLLTLDVSFTGITELDLSNNTSVYDLTMNGVAIDSIDFSMQDNLNYFQANNSQLQHIDLGGNTQLDEFFCNGCELSHLDLSAHSDIFRVNVSNNQLTSFNIKNGNNTAIDFVIASGNPDLTCIDVDDPVYSYTEWTNIDEHTSFSTDCSTAQDCSAFGTAPVDLTKSFDPVNGNYDRLQVKFYKGTGQERYTVEDNAACDIEYWAYRYKDHPEDPWTQIPQAERDTTLLPYTTVKKNNGKALFKWPIKYRLNNGTNQVQPNHGYQWRVRCYCDQGALVDGSQVITPWSEVKYFNTPDFDPSTGLYFPPMETLGQSGAKSHADDQLRIELYPNPNDGQGFDLRWLGSDQEELQLRIFDLTGQTIVVEQFTDMKKGVRTVRFDDRLSPGIYFVEVSNSREKLTERMVVR